MPKVKEQKAAPRVEVGRKSAGQDEYGFLPTVLEIEEGEAHRQFFRLHPLSEPHHQAWLKAFCALCEVQGMKGVATSRCVRCHVLLYGRWKQCAHCGKLRRIPEDQAQLEELIVGVAGGVH